MIAPRTLTLLASAAALLFAGPALAARPQVEVTRTAPTTVEVRWTGPAAVDLYRADRADIALKAATLVSANDRDGHETLTLPATARASVIVRDRATGMLVRAAERVVPLEQGSNFRDIGGYPAAGGKQVRWGRIYRSGATPLLTDADLGTVRSLGLVAMVDLRSDEERQLAPTRIDGVPYHAVGYSMRALMPAGAAAIRNGGAVYRGMPALLAPQLRVVFDLLKRDVGPIEYNCSAGQDRTGFVTAMVLSALGTPRDVIVADYLQSTRLRRPEWEMTAVDPALFPGNVAAQMFAMARTNPAYAKPQPLVEADGTPFLLSALDEVEKRYGSVEGYLAREIGVSAADLARLRAAYTE